MHPRQSLLPSFLLRTGIALAFLYAATESFIAPLDWIGFFPEPLRALVPGKTLLLIFLIIEIALAFWLLSGKQIRTASLASATTLLLIILANLGALDIVFRDIPILFASLALRYLHES